MTEITEQDWHDHCYIEELIAQGKDDVRFVIERNPEPDSPSDLYFVEVYDWVTGKLLDSHTSEDAYAEVEVMRYCQSTPLEQRWAEDAEREHQERMNGGGW